MHGERDKGKKKIEDKSDSRREKQPIITNWDSSEYSNQVHSTLQGDQHPQYHPSYHTQRNQFGFMNRAPPHHGSLSYEQHEPYYGLDDYEVEEILYPPNHQSVRHREC